MQSLLTTGAVDVLLRNQEKWTQRLSEIQDESASLTQKLDDAQAMLSKLDNYTKLKCQCKELESFGGGTRGSAGVAGDGAAAAAAGSRHKMRRQNVCTAVQ